MIEKYQDVSSPMKRCEEIRIMSMTKEKTFKKVPLGKTQKVKNMINQQQMAITEFLEGVNVAPNNN